ncbi:MAG: hypothetical protein IT443_01650 [Phycisphaeraceae bacterium]|nr:hypothetical protein [Phycisphaeraceae bacterium]
MMRSTKTTWLLSAAILFGVAAMVWQGQTSAVGAEKSQDKRQSKDQVKGIYAKLDLTRTQEKDVIQIQEDTQDKIRRARKQERDDIVKLLTPAQKRKLEELEAAALSDKEDDSTDQASSGSKSKSSEQQDKSRKDKTASEEKKKN